MAAADGSRRSYLTAEPPGDAGSQRTAPTMTSVTLSDGALQGPPPHLDLSVFTELPDSEHNALCCLEHRHPLRRLCRVVYTDKRFGSAVLILIVANSLVMCITYAWPCGTGKVHPCGPSSVADGMDWFFTCAFTVEMLIKVIALGLVRHPRSYLRFGWNVLDFVTVVASWLEKGAIVPNASVLRLLRVLRPLRTMSRVRGLRTLMGALFGAMPEIRDNIVLLGFLVTIFAILGVHLFEGQLRQRCVVVAGEYGLVVGGAVGDGWRSIVPFLLPSMAGQNGAHCGGTLSCHAPSVLAGNSLTLEVQNVECTSDAVLRSGEGDDLSRDPLDYDNLGAALLLVLKVFTGDDWPEDMNKLQNVVGMWPPFLFFFFAIMVGYFFATNLFLAVLISAYYTNATKEKEDSAERETRAMALWEQVRKGIRQQQTPGPSANSPAALMMMKSLEDRRRPQSVSASRTGPLATPDMRPGDPRRVSDKPELPPPQRQSFVVSPIVVTNPEPGRKRASVASSNPIPIADLMSPAFAASSTGGHRRGSSRQGSWGDLRKLSRQGSDAMLSREVSGTHRESLGPATRTKHRRPTFAAAHIPFPVSPMHEAPQAHAQAGSVDSRRESRELLAPPPPIPIVLPVPSQLDVLRKRVADMVLAPQAQNFVMLVTCFNIVVLAMVHYRIEEKPFLNSFQCVAGLVCFFVFAIEIVLKTFGLGVKKAFFDRESGAGYNCFDLFLVLVSIPGVITTNMCTSNSSGSAFGAFRAFRMMRALRVLRRWPSVHALMNALVRCLSEGVYVSLLLLLQIFIFSILGMQLFERKFPSETPRESPPPDEYWRQNYNSLWEAGVTCFVIITGDAWGAVMKRGMKDTSDGAFVYFCTLFFLGNYVLVNVFVAVILDKLDAATHDLERTGVLLRVSGVGNGCDGVYDPYPQGEHEMVWQLRLEDDEPHEAARYLYLTTEESDGVWVIWSSEEREPDEGFAASEAHEDRMPPEITLWRRTFLGTEWDADILVEEIDEQEAAYGGKAVLSSASLGALALLDSNDVAIVSVPAGGDLQEAAEVTFDGLRVAAVVPGGQAEAEGVQVGWRLTAVNRQPVEDLPSAIAMFAFAEADITVLDFRRNDDETDESQWQPLRWQEDECTTVKKITTSEKCTMMRSVRLLGGSCIHPRSPLRLLIGKIVHSYAFETTIMCFIALNVIFLAFDFPKAGPELRTALDVGDYVFTSVFFVEMVMKIIAMGFWSQERSPSGGRDELGAYFRDPWNCIDCFVVVTAVAALLPGAPEEMKVFRSLRTLRLVIRFEQLRIVIEALVKTVPAVAQGLTVCAFIFFVFAILGCQLFKGTFYQCNDPERISIETCNGTFIKSGGGPFDNDTTLTAREWSNAPDHFDNVGSSLYTLIVVAIGEAWSDIMYQGIDAVGEGKAPELNYRPVNALFFIIFHVIGSFFCLNLIIGILISEFTDQRRQLDGTQGSDMSEKQQSYIAAEKAVLHPIMFRVRPMPPVKDFWGLRLRCFRATMDHNMDHVVTTCIVVNMVILSTVHHKQTAAWVYAQNWGNWVCTVIFAAEAVVKLAGLGPYFYFRENWNRFDFVIVCVSLMGMFVPSMSGFSAVRVLRVGRLFRLVEHAKGLQKLFNTMFQGDNLYYFGNIGVFCFAILFMFAVAGVSLFGSLEPAEGVDHNMNFHNVPNALITLFAIWTTEAWLDVRNGLVQGADECGTSTTGSCGLPVLGHIYALSFVIVGSVVVLNLFAAVVVELFDKQEAQERCSREIAAVAEFRQRWCDRFGPVHLVTEVPVANFLAGLREHDEIEAGQVKEMKGLVPNRLRRLPRRPPPGAPADSMGEAHLPLKPTPLQLLAYLSALGIPVRAPGPGPNATFRTSVVRYSDAVYALAARAFELQLDDIVQIHDCGLTRGPRIADDVFLLAHWYAVQLLLNGLRRVQRKRRNMHRREMTEPISPVLGGIVPVTNNATVAPEPLKALDCDTHSATEEHQRRKESPTPQDERRLSRTSASGVQVNTSPGANGWHPEQTPVVSAERRQPPPMPLRPPSQPSAPDCDLPQQPPLPPPPPPPPPRPPSPRARVRALLTPIAAAEKIQQKDPESKEQRLVAARAANTALRSELAMLQQQLQQHHWALS
eukprot:TRINITY_DN915_c3_g1_i1.p1 TRINITY_DN915_c3_g1~~TRINITY_DN915_c3_g1_i1.p1  ORF type:complete len:2117 (+),score=680.72 TRINITY_DN915_c3_g1_i1:180-6530(+)